MKMIKPIMKPIAATLLALSLSATAYADQALTANVARLTMDVTNKIALASIESCRAKGISISVSVVDRNGIIQTQLRDTVAPPVSLPISFKKAYTAVMFNANGSALKSQASSPLQDLDVNLAFMAGSVPIQAGGKLYGAIGVSGAPDGMDDEKCAADGLAAVIEDLEML